MPRDSRRPPGSHLGPILLPCWPHWDAKTISPQACGQLFAWQIQDAPKYQNIAKNRPKTITHSTE